jgi:hypothetical protein
MTTSGRDSIGWFVSPRSLCTDSQDGSVIEKRQYRVLPRSALLTPWR